MKIIKTIFYFYKVIDLYLPKTCRFIPTCGEYSYSAFMKFGVLKGLYLTIKRISKCHPFHKGGLDLLPDSFSWKKI